MAADNIVDQKRVEALEKDLGEFRKDISELAASVKRALQDNAGEVEHSARRLVGRASDEARRFAQRVESQGEDLYYAARDQVHHGYDQIDATVRANPVTSLVEALGVGFLLGILSRR